MILESPAKINLGLEVHHRRPGDGYHYIASIFVPIYPGDRIQLTPSEKPALETENHLTGSSREDFNLVSQGDGIRKNLAWRALEAIHRLSGKSFFARLEKRIPTGTGLGGGSSNAGTILAAGQKEYGLDPADVEREALALGADVPFFLHPTGSLVTGTGEIRTPFPVAPLYGVLCFSGIHVNTKLAYQNLKRALQQTPPPRSLSSLTDGVASAIGSAQWQKVTPLENHFESVVFPEHPVLDQVKRSFYESGAAYASMSGSGSAVYGLVSDPDTAKELQQKMELRFPLFQFLTVQSTPNPGQGID